jgi:hypothetical protein
MGLFEELGGECERQYKTVILTTTNTDSQIILVPWTPPANKQAILECLHVSNTTAGAGIVKLFDADVTTGGAAPSATKPSYIGSAAAPILPWYNVGANANLILDVNSCPHITLQGGLACQVTVQPTHIFASIVVF